MDIISNISNDSESIMEVNTQLVKMQISCVATVKILPKEYINQSDFHPEFITLKIEKCHAKKLRIQTVTRSALCSMTYDITPLLIS